jgi:hypothetical protein
MKNSDDDQNSYSADEVSSSSGDRKKDSKTNIARKGKRKQPSPGAPDGNQDKAEKRREANRRAAAESRQRRLDLIRNLEETAAALSEQIREVKEENEDLKRQLKDALSGQGAPAAAQPAVAAVGRRGMSAQGPLPGNGFAPQLQNQLGLLGGVDPSILGRLNSQQLAAVLQISQQQHQGNQATNQMSQAQLNQGGSSLPPAQPPQAPPQPQAPGQNNNNEVLLNFLADMLQKRDELNSRTA